MLTTYLGEHDEVTGYAFMRFCRALGVSASPGNVYPLLRSLETQGLLVSHADGRRKVYTTTESGRRVAATAALRRVPQAVRELFLRQMGLAVRVDWQDPDAVALLAQNSRRAVVLLDEHIAALRTAGREREA